MNPVITTGRGRNGKNYRAIAANSAGTIGVFVEQDSLGTAVQEAAELFQKVTGTVPKPKAVTSKFYTATRIKRELEQAIRDQSEVGIGYTAASGDYTERTIKPNRLDHPVWGGDDAVFAYDVDNDGIRQFKLGRIDYIEVEH